MLLQRNILLLLCHGKPTEAQYGLIRDFLKYCSNLYVSHYCSRCCQCWCLRNEVRLTRYFTPVIERKPTPLRKTTNPSTPYMEPVYHSGVKRHRKLRCTCSFFPIPSQLFFVAGGSQHKKKIRKNHDKSRQHVHSISLLVH